MKSILLLFITCCFSLCISAQVGQLDPSFGSGGTLFTYPLLGGTEEIVVQPDGKVLAAGSKGIARFLSDGSVDNSFSSDGFEASTFPVSRLALQADGKVIAGGISGNDLLISRYNANGTLDQAFNGTGTAMINYGSQTPPFLSAIRLQGNGKIVVGAEAIINGLGKIILSRLTTSGSIDPQFAAQGFLHTDFFQALSRNSFAILPDNKILICGRTYAPANYSVARYTADGSPDATFGSGGTATVDYGEYEEATSVIVQSDGKILLLGGIIYYPQEEFVDALVRLNKDGTPDNSFGNNGQVIVALNILEANVQRDIALQDDGKIIAGGNATIRLNTNGTLDNSFGINGILDNIFLNDLAIFGNKLYTVDGIQVSRYFLQGFNVNIISPSPYTVFDAPGPVQITVDAISPSALIERVELYYKNTLVGTQYTKPYIFDFTNDITTSYEDVQLTAKAYDEDGNVGVSAPVGLFEQLPKPLSIRFLSPGENANFSPPANITFEVSAADASFFGAITKLEFYNGPDFIGNGYHDRRHQRDFLFAWNNVPEGQYEITAKAINNTGRSISAVRHIFVGDNKPPLVELYRPGFNETFMAQSNITFTAQAFDDDGIAKVEFFAGNNLIGSSTTAPFTFLWKNVPVGDYSVTASATDNKGLSASTSPRTIHVIIPEITSFGLIDATKDEVIGGITDGAVLDLSMLPTYLNVKAYPTTNRVGSVVFMLDGKGVRLENGPPYALAGDNPTGDYHNWRPSLGDHTLTAIPYTKYNAKGLEGVGLTIHFKVIESGPTMFADNGGTPTPFEAPQFRIYPNPATQILNVSTSTFTSNSTLLLTIVNLQGEIVRKINLSNAGSVAHINISSLPAGSYLLKITNQGQMSTHRFVKLK